MRYLVLFIVFITGALASSIGKIESVMLYSDRAVVTTSSSLKVKAGMQTVRLDVIPFSTIANSHKIHNMKGATLVDVRLVKSKRFAHTRLTQLYKEQKALKQKRKALNDELTIIKAQNNYLETLVESKKGEKSAQWGKVLDAYAKTKQPLVQQSREITEQLEALNKKLQTTQQAIHKLNPKKQKESEQIEVTLYATKAKTINVALEYAVYGPRWEPFYEINVDTNKEKVEINYYAMIKQNVHALWKDVDIELSTTKAYVRATLPKLHPWRVQEQRHYPQPVMARGNMKMASAPMEMMADEAPAPLKEVQVSENATSFSYRLPDHITISGGELPSRIKLHKFTQEGKLQYDAVPKRTPHVYVKTSLKNHSKFALLAGKSNVFIDGSFATSSYMAQIYSDQRFDLALGVDSALQVKRKFIKQFDKNEGIFSQEHAVAFAYEFVVTNRKKRDITVTVHDQLPVSGHEDIKVMLTKPKKLALNKHKIFKLPITVKANKKVSLPFEFEVHYPQEMKVSGL
jgi:uncharacterized protein (TIGR02231 family)